jgi:glutathione S-transferase
MHNVDFEYKQIDIMAGEHKKPEFLAINPLGLVPVLIDTQAEGGKFTLSESSAIFTYLCDVLNIHGDYGVPTSATEKARVNEYIGLHSSKVRTLTTEVLRPFINAIMTKADPTELVTARKAEALKWFPDFEARLKANGGYIANGKPSFMDLQAFTEFAQFDQTDVGLKVFDFATEAPAIHEWLTKVRAAPAYDEAHKGSKGFVAMMKK